MSCGLAAGNSTGREQKPAAAAGSLLFRSLLCPGLSGVRAAPDLIVAGGDDYLRRAVQIDVSYIGAKCLGFNEGSHLRPSYTAVGGMQERARLAAGPDISVVSCIAQQWMIRVRSSLPALPAVQRALQDTCGDPPGDGRRQSLRGGQGCEGGHISSTSRR